MTQNSVVKVRNKAGLGFKKENPNQADYRTNFLIVKVITGFSAASPPTILKNLTCRFPSAGFGFFRKLAKEIFFLKEHKFNPGFIWGNSNECCHLTY